MTVARHYIMHAKAGEAAALQSALERLAEGVLALPGCEGVEMLRDIGKEDRFIFIEKWESVDAHKAGGALLPKDLLAPLGSLLDGPPEGAYLDYLSI